MRSVLSLVFIGVLGALIGSFGNVVIYRLPRQESIVFPGSHCPHCGHQLSALELIPIISWLALRGRCRNCRQGISPRYPLIEALMAAGFVLIIWRWPLELYSFTALPLLVIYAMLVMMSGIDIDQQILPDSLTLPAIALALAGSLLYAPDSGLPRLNEAIFAAALGAGIIVLINRLGGLILRRFSDTKERLWPIGMDQVNIAALGGVLGGWRWGLGLALASLIANLATRRTLHISEPALYGLWFVGLIFGSTGLWLSPLTALNGTLLAAGVVAIVGAAFWWLRDLGKKIEVAESDEADEEPIAMGFGDVKLAAILGAVLGWQNLLVALLLSFIFGALGGLILRAFGGGRQVPFGPYLTLGGLVALFYGTSLLSWYLGLLGL